MTEAELYALFDERGIPYETFHHKAVKCLQRHLNGYCKKLKIWGSLPKISTALQVMLNTVTVKNLPLYLHTLM